MKEPLTVQAQPQNSPAAIYHGWVDPFIYGFILLAIMGYLGSSIEGGTWLSGFVFLLSTLVVSALVWFVSRRQTFPLLDVSHPGRDFWATLSWYGVYMLLGFLLKANVPLDNEFGKWVWFVIAPLLLLFILQGNGRNFKTVLTSIGFRRQGIGKALLLGLLAYVIMLPAVVFFLPESQSDQLLELFQSPARALGMLVLSFILSLITAATTEEVLFRGILQSRLAKLMNSEIRSCLIVAFLFGIYHLPYAYFMADWPTHGNLIWAVSSVLAEQMIAGLVLGTLWIRTHNIAAPVIFHALVNTIAIVTSLNFG